jgi:O-antigen/teichoic acid export membrane protein
MTAADSSAIPTPRAIGRGSDYVVTFGTEFLVLAASLLALRLAARYWGTAGFGEFVIARRVFGMLYLPVLGGLGLALTRYMASYRDEHPESVGQYLGAAFLALLPLLALQALILNLWPQALGRLLLGTDGYRGLMRSLSLAVAGLALHGLAYGAFRGLLDMRRANLLQALDMGVVPLALFAVSGLRVETYVALLGSVWLVAGAGAVLWLLARHLGSARGGGGAALRGRARELLGYGLPRVPGEFALGALLALPVTLAARFAGVAEAGYVGLGVAVVQMVGSVFAPLGQVLLPMVSARARQAHHDLVGEVSRLTWICVGLAALALVGIELLAGLGVTLYLGPAFVPAVPLVRITVLGAVPYVAYVVLRNILDALHVVPLNAKNLVIALAGFLAGAFLNPSPVGVTASFAVSLGILGGLTVWDARRAFARLAA